MHTLVNGQTCSSLKVHRVADDLVGIVLGFLPADKGSGAGVGCSRQVVRGAG